MWYMPVYPGFQGSKHPVRLQKTDLPPEGASDQIMTRHPMVSSRPVLRYESSP